jgi:hypothetical protein
MKIKGVLWHSTGANNPNLKRYVQPSDTKPAADTYSKTKWLEVLGKNTGGNDWNHISRSAGLNCWIGKLADGTVTTVQTMPWDYQPWGCGGDCNNGWIQFEICEDGLTDKNYFAKAYREACEITAYLCKMYNINPNGKVSFKGKQVPTILCHQDAYKLGLGSNHGDIYNWFPKFGKNMDTVRSDVASIMKGAPPIASVAQSTGTSSGSSGGSSGGTTSTDTTVEEEPVGIKSLIDRLSIGSITATEAEIAIIASENFAEYNWTYSLTTLKNLKTLPENKLILKTQTSKVQLKDLLPNNSYLFELLIRDEFRNVIKSPSIIFSTKQDYPDAVEDITFDFQTAKVSFRPPSSWGDYRNRTKGYRVSIYVNGEEKAYSDTLIKPTSSSNTNTKNISSLLSKLTFVYDDSVQVCVSPWVIDESGAKIFAEIQSKCSKPVYIQAELPLIYKIFLKIQNSYKQILLYLRK